ncbi:MAG: V-type ATP synthase subunit F [Acidobacteriota bacterium]|nr:V-type ATP synthase subunit F [Acidobacteriota bacterium]
MKFFLIADADTLLVFSLAGIKGRTTKTREEATSTLKEALENKEVGVILITERIAETIREKVNEVILKAETPVIEIPDVKGPLHITRFKEIMMTLAQARKI